MYLNTSNNELGTSPHAVVLDRSTRDAASLVVDVESSLRAMAPGAVLEVPCPSDSTRTRFSSWCLSTGRRLLDPFDPARRGSVLIENSPAAAV